MPIYAYKCSACNHEQDVLQKLSDPLLTDCPACGQSTYVKQVTAAGFQLKGSGWYVTDFRNNGSSGKPAAGASGAESGGTPASSGGGASDSGASGSGASGSGAPSGSGASSGAAGSGTSGSAASTSSPTASA